MTFISSWKRCACVLLMVLSVGSANTWAEPDRSPGDLRRLGLEAFDQGRYSDAERDLRLALEEDTKRSPSFETAQILGDLAAVLCAEDRYVEAEPIRRRGL